MRLALLADAAHILTDMGGATPVVEVHHVTLQTGRTGGEAAGEMHLW